MPRGDRTGPRGMGAMTGRMAGFCARFGMPGYVNSAAGRGFGKGFGRGGGKGQTWRNCFHALGLPSGMRLEGTAVMGQALESAKEKQALKNQTEMLLTEIVNIKKRLDEMENVS